MLSVKEELKFDEVVMQLRREEQMEEVMEKKLATLSLGQGSGGAAFGFLPQRGSMAGGGRGRGQQQQSGRGQQQGGRGGSGGGHRQQHGGRAGCGVCGSQGHYWKWCPETTCHACGFKGHVAENCDGGEAAGNGKNGGGKGGDNMVLFFGGHKGAMTEANKIKSGDNGWYDGDEDDGVYF